MRNRYMYPPNCMLLVKSLSSMCSQYTLRSYSYSVVCTHYEVISYSYSVVCTAPVVYICCEISGGVVFYRSSDSASDTGFTWR